MANVAMRRERRAEIFEESLQAERIGGGVVLRSHQFGRKLVQHVKRFVCHSRTADDADRISSVFIRNSIETFGNVTNSFVPGCGDQLAALLVTNHRRADAIFVIDERMTKPALHAKKLAVDSVHVSIARDRRASLRHRASQATSGNRPNRNCTSRCLREFPWTCLMAVSCIEQRAGRTNLDAVSALRTIEPAEIRADDGVRAAPAGFDRVFAHPLVANARAAFAENAALRIVCDHRREISLGVVVFLFGETFFEAAPVERHLLEFTLTTAIADRTIERMIREQKLRHAALGLLDLFALSRDDHAVGAGDGAGGLQLRHLLDAHETHATRSLQREVGVITERRNVETLFATHVDQTRAFRDFERLYR